MIQDLERIEESQFEFQSPEQIRIEYLIGVWGHAYGGQRHDDSPPSAGHLWNQPPFLRTRWSIFPLN